LKHRWRLDNNYLIGITARKWWRLLRENGFAVDPAYWHRGAFISLLSVFNSLSAWREAGLFERQIEATRIEHPPLFVLGHWRTGTTFLHNLLSRDPQFAYPNLFDVVHPYSFLSASAGEKKRFADSLPESRPMDNVSYHLDLPQEDECALALACLRSPDLALNFPRRSEEYGRYLTFEDASPAEVAEWKATLLWFVKKLTLRSPRPMLLKSPGHTGRIRLLLELFPDARFVNIHREPFTTFQSCRHTVNAFNWFTYLQKPDLSQVDHHILVGGEAVFDAYFDQRALIPAGRLVDVAYEDLEARPVEVTRDIYARLGLPGFEAFQPRLETYLSGLKAYRKNELPDLSPETRKAVATHWRRCFEEWGYPA
jgi:hypothetical protein